MKRRSRTPKIVFSVVIAVLIIAGVAYFGYVFFKVENVKVEGFGKFTEVYITGLADIDPDTHMLSLDEEKVKTNIEEAEPYLEVVSVTKQLPQTVVIKVVERQPKVYIEHAGQYLLSDKDGNVLEIFSTLPEGKAYPVVSGFTIGGAALGKPITTEDTFKITVMGEIVSALESKKAAQSIVTIDLSDVNNIRMATDTGLNIKFGQADKVADKVKWIDKMLPQLSKDGRKTGMLDVSTGNSGIFKMDESDSQTSNGVQTEPDQPAEGDQNVEDKPANGDQPDGEGDQPAENGSSGTQDQAGGGGEEG